MSLYFLKSLWEIWESSCPDQATDKIGQPGNLVESIAWLPGLRGENFRGKRIKRNEVTLVVGPRSLLELQVDWS